MTRRARTIVSLCALAGVAALFGWGVAGLPAFGHYQGAYGNQLNREAVAERHSTNVITAVVFDYRGFDTLGEEFILFAAVGGVTLLLRRGDEEEDEEALLRETPDDAPRSDALRALGLLLVAPFFLLGLWLVAFGFVTPGGGFQGGVVLAGALLLVYLLGGFHPFKRALPNSVVEFFEGFGAGTYAALGLVGLIAGGTYLHNFIGPGTRGTLMSGGSMPLLNWATAIEVCSAMLLLFTEFLQRYVVPALRSDV